MYGSEPDTFSQQDLIKLQDIMSCLKSCIPFLLLFVGPPGLLKSTFLGVNKFPKKPLSMKSRLSGAFFSPEFHRFYHILSGLNANLPISAMREPWV